MRTQEYMTILMSLLPSDTILEELKKLPGWQWKQESGRLYKSFRFHDFCQAWQFLSAVAIQAEKMNHHPDWSNSYNRVEIFLTTHDAGGVTANDIALAEHIDAYSRL